MPIDESKLRRYESKEIVPYRSLPQLLRQLPTGKRSALYITHVRQMERYEQIAIEAGMKPICVWSLNHEKPMTQEQLAARDYILTNECVPPQYDLFIFNKSCETSINLRGRMDYMIVHSSEEEARTQARGRYRNDLDVLYVYEPDVEQDIVVPDDFLDVYIYKEDKAKLRAQIDMKDSKGHPMPYNQLFMLVEASGYQLEHGRKNNRPYIIIREL